MADLLGRGAVIPLPVNDGGTGATTQAGARTGLGLGSIATQAASAVAITGGTVTGITDLAVADGGTGASTASSARANLGTFGSSLRIESHALSTGNAVGLGIVAPTVSGTGGAMVTFDGARWEQRATGTSQGGAAGPISVSGGGVVFDMGVDFTVWFQFRTDSALTNYCFYIGVAASAPTLSSSTPPTNSLLARFIPGNSVNDVKLTAFGRAGGSASAGATFGADVAVDTAYTMRLRNVVADGKAYFGLQTGLDLFGSFGTEAEVTTLPAAGTGLGWVCQAGAYTAGTSRNFQWRRMVALIGV
jgi:hypothetical protein